MKLLEQIAAFPVREREILETLYGIDSAEAFYEHAVHNPEGLRQAMEVSAEEADRLVKIVEKHLSPARIAAIRNPPARHARGVAMDRDHPKASKP